MGTGLPLLSNGLWGPQEGKQSTRLGLTFRSHRLHSPSSTIAGQTAAPEGMGWSPGAGEAPVTQAQT